MSKPTTPRDDLLFGVRRSVRYHDKRQQFFTYFNDITTLVALLFGTYVVMTIVWEISNETRLFWIRIVPALVVSLLSGVVLVFRFTQKARHHWDLRNAFIDLEKKIVSTTDEDKETIMELTKERLEIESGEPKILRVLDILCHNEVYRSMYSEEEQKGNLYDVKYLQRFLAHFCSFKHDKIKLET